MYAVKRFALFISLVMCHNILLSQGVLDGIYVKEHIPTKNPNIYRSVYPIHLYYQYEDRHHFDCVADTLPKVISGLGQYPTMLGQTLVSDHIKEVAAIIKTLPEQSCRLLFYHLYENAANTTVESFEPPFLKFRLDSVSLCDTGFSPYFLLKTKPFLRDFTTPFYMKNTEVTNSEYREFVNYIKDSAARTFLFRAGIERYIIQKRDAEGNMVAAINWEVPIHWRGDEERPVLHNGFYLPENQRYYIRREIDTRKLNYLLQDPSGKNTFDTINVYPDTLCWVSKFPDLFNHPTAIMYFWHPAFNDYPVVGLTRAQINAYLHWKTGRENKNLAKAGKTYRVQYRLPGEMQWELAAAMQLYRNKKTFGHYLYEAADNAYFTNLSLAPMADTFVIGSSKDSLQIYNGIGSAMLSTALSQGSHQKENVNELTLKAQQRKKGKYQGPHEITGLDNNVSEYLAETLNSHYRNLLNIRWKMLESWNSTAVRLLVSQEKTLFETMNPGVCLVRGANWMDQRTSTTEGMNAKCFVNGTDTYPTLGFRYVTTITWIKK